MEPFRTRRAKRPNEADGTRRLHNHRSCSCPLRTYVAQRPGAFGGLVQARDLAGYQLEALPSVNIRDYYFDTEDAELLRQGMCLRVREQGGERRALLRGIRPDDPTLEIEAALDGPHTEVFDTPKGLLHEALESLVGGSAPGLVEPLHPLIRFRQYRTPRMAYDGTRLLGLLSFDVVVIELPEGPYATNELDIEPPTRVTRPICTLSTRCYGRVASCRSRSPSSSEA